MQNWLLSSAYSFKLIIGGHRYQIYEFIIKNPRIKILMVCIYRNPIIAGTISKILQNSPKAGCPNSATNDDKAPNVFLFRRKQIFNK